MNVNSKISLITSNTAPSSSELGKGELAYGTVDGLARLYGNDGSGVVQLNSTETEQMLYFSSQDELNEFLLSGDVPTGGWYATVADTVYEQYGEWVAYKITFEDIDGTTTGVYKPTFTQIGASSNGNAFYNLVPNESGIFTDTSVVSSMFNQTIDTINMGNYAHTRYFLYSTDGYINNLFRTFLCYKQKGGNQYRVELSSDDFILEDVGVGYKASIDYNMANYTGNPGTDAEDNQYFTIWQLRSSDSSPFDPLYLVVKEITSDGEPWINWGEYISTEPTPEPSNNYSSVNLSGTLANGVNNIKMSNFTSTGTLNSLKAINLQDDYTIAVNGYGAGLTKLTVDASIPFFGMPDYNFPDMNIQLSNTIHGSHLWKIPAQYSSGSKLVKWQDELTIDLPPQADSGVQTMAQFDGDTYISVDVMQYMEGDAPNLTGTLKIEDA